ncbi:CBS domain-containing protein [Azospirillum picis]|uniref:CBS domain-containing protein n=1 Tax=Azospirillum picis TaxID=488438 RepID=A0ABU0MFP9_9PROT|nr:CBS domain-containing protein [Azospirillum picis]MBP2298699.1 CBS domain-containing protein [Azospirillum picis]MDQ0532252.1 CBS domain-containing protein [Azospirillum picis]
MKAIDLMTPRVITIGPDATIAEAARTMLENHISGMPVVDAGGKVVGIISEGDLLRRVELGTVRHRSWWLGIMSGGTLPAEDFIKSHARKVADVMTTHVTTVDEAASPEDIVRTMETRRIKRVPVVRQGQLVGIISRANLLRALASGVSDTTGATAATSAATSVADDRSLKERVTAAVRELNWEARSHDAIIVRNGVVQLWGFASSASQRDALRVAAEGVPGVKGVENNIQVVDPAESGAWGL